jgi:hypothetical protein
VRKYLIAVSFVFIIHTTPANGQGFPLVNCMLSTSDAHTYVASITEFGQIEYQYFVAADMTLTNPSRYCLTS